MRAVVATRVVGRPLHNMEDLKVFLVYLQCQEIWVVIKEDLRQEEATASPALLLLEAVTVLHNLDLQRQHTAPISGQDKKWTQTVQHASTMPKV